MERIRVLIVDDHRLFRQGLANLLESEPAFAVVGTAASGEEALVIAAETQPDVAVVDLRMPNTSGIEVTARLLDHQPSLGVVVLTASQENSDLVAAIQAGARGYVLKNADADELFDVIRHVYDGGTALCDLVTPQAIEILAPISLGANGAFTGQHEVGGILVLTDMVNGGQIGDVLVYWLLQLVRSL